MKYRLSGQNLDLLFLGSKLAFPVIRAARGLVGPHSPALLHYR